MGGHRQDDTPSTCQSTARQGAQPGRRGEGSSQEHEEEFNQQVEEQLREEDFIERCFEELWEEEEERESFIPSRDLPHLQGIQSDVHKDADYPIYSRLNPNAKEFTPGIQRHVM
ncbi:hypothetical protein CgunFtcFv8_017131 [Champsocephalus gunnari]|uniref:Polyadenylate-binding protein-interacting protein 2 n=1 Tax=Champsocephalus gunnari TaxID=52237 RepID=A0AAN8DJT7_CHAGU|nr:hypothetical protein CgunFtcFv8_017131 [Champsocephalus gunnari]